MRVLIFEHICGGGLSGVDLRPTLARKGGAMLENLVADFLAAGVKVVTTLDTRASLPLPGASVERVAPGSDFSAIFDRLARSCDAALAVAPEFDGLLEGWCARIEALGVRSLGSSPAAIRLTGDKFGLAAHWARAGIPTPATLAGLPKPDVAQFPCIAKPRFGAGCEDTFVCRSAEDLRQLPRRADWIVQPFIPGIAASAACVVHDGHARPLRAGEQRVEGAGRLSYRGGRLPLPEDLERRALDLATRAIACVPGLRGYVGVDLVLGESARDDSAIELNPRPTVAFAGLRRLCATSLARAILDPRAPLAWRPGRLVYDASGAGRWEGGP
ncbi:MAG: ATP-grasp domain-containing protein [Planctomycetota bacterium]|nr:ATP-grasp domain-containing protein [Planctomycetota bacterium]